MPAASPVPHACVGVVNGLCAAKPLTTTTAWGLVGEVVADGELDVDEPHAASASPIPTTTPKRKVRTQLSFARTTARYTVLVRFRRCRS